MIKFFRHIKDFFRYKKDKIRMLKYIHKKNKIIDAYFYELEADAHGIKKPREDIKKIEELEKDFILPESKTLLRK